MAASRRREKITGVREVMDNGDEILSWESSPETLESGVTCGSGGMSFSESEEPHHKLGGHGIGVPPRREQRHSEGVTYGSGGMSYIPNEEPSRQLGGPGTGQTYSDYMEAVGFSRRTEPDHSFQKSSFPSQEKKAKKGKQPEDFTGQKNVHARKS